MKGHHVAKRSLRLAAAFGGAVLVNVLLFGLLAWHARQERALPAWTEPTAVDLAYLPPPEPETPEEIDRPRPPEPEPDLDFRPDLRPPAFEGVAADFGFAVELDLGAPTGLDVGPAVFQAHELDEVPRVALRVPPDYPYAAKRRGVEGVVKVQLLIEIDGSVGEVRLLESTPPEIFDQAVREAVPRWKFSPGRLAGEPVTSWIVTNVRFTLD